MQCPTCGSRAPEGADVCADCGMDLQNLSAPALPTPVPPAPVPPAPANATPANATPAAEFLPADSPTDSNISHDEPSDFDAFEFDDFTAETPTDSAPTIDLKKPSIDTAPTDLASTDLAPTNLTPAQQATLTLKRGGVLTEEKFVIGSLASIGRFDPESGPVDVDMANLPEASYVSRHHAEIQCVDGNWQIKDLGSRNGTFVRAASGGAFARVQGEHAVRDGDEVSLGNARFEFRCEN